MASDPAPSPDRDAMSGVAVQHVEHVEHIEHIEHIEQNEHIEHKGLRLVALYQVFKGSLAVVVATLLVAFGHQRVVELIGRVETQLSVHGASAVSRSLGVLAQDGTEGQLVLAVAFLLAYSCLRYAEAWGLWRERVWGEWLAVISASLYLPVEVWGLLHGVTWGKALVFIGNLALVLYVGRALRDALRERSKI